MKRRATEPIADVEVVVRGPVPADAREYAEDKIATLTTYSRDPILHARVKLTGGENPGMSRAIVAQGNLDVNGRFVRAQVAARNATEAIDLLRDKLRGRLARMAPGWEGRRGAMPSPEPNQWRHSSESMPRPDHFPRPTDERQLVRHKTFELSRATPEEAAFDLDQMGYHFQLFTDLHTGQDSIVYRGGPTGYRLAYLRPEPVDGGGRAGLSVSDRAAPELTVADAIERLTATGAPFLFFADAASCRGRVLYLRYDGHYGLITPA
jgi:ribosome-associated translation inhibitor RaiA